MSLVAYVCGSLVVTRYHESQTYRADLLCHMAGNGVSTLVVDPADPHPAPAAALSDAPAVPTDIVAPVAEHAARLPAALARLAELRAAPILVVGCGNSTLSEDLFKEGFTDILSNDYSSVIIDRLVHEVYPQHPVLKFQQMDVRCMALPDASRQFIIDKGTLDAVMCVSDDRDAAVRAMLTECHRILVPGGRYLYISHGSPAARLPFLRWIAGWRIEMQFIVDRIGFYICTKL